MDKAAPYVIIGIVSMRVTAHMMITFLPERIDITVNDTSVAVAAVFPPIE